MNHVYARSKEIVFIWLRCENTVKFKIVRLSGIWPEGSLHAVELLFENIHLVSLAPASGKLAFFLW